MTDSKKEQQKSQKAKQNNTKGLKGVVKNQHKEIDTTDKKQKQKPQKTKYFKGVKYQINGTNKNFQKKVSDEKGLAMVWITRLFFIALVPGFIYVVDFEKFTRLTDGASYCLNKTVSLLPPAVVRQGEVAVEYIRPVAVDTVNKLNVLLNGTSTFLNTNPLIKDHWTNIREISSICSAHLVDYMRTLYVQTTGYCHDFKNKLF